ncbi:DUF6232 family protein [Rheinheimera texasensis]|uniref:DUF6232 family protein n=1 Tax=Rheinheimera texasensis TaxID=306205 RepID=UPI0004E27FD0|nr:DUF6232 family protein [Rheinheimera texasensis]
MEEKTFFNQQGIEVTSRRLKVYNQTFSIAHISAIRSVYKEGKKNSSITLSLFAIVCIGIDYWLLGLFLFVIAVVLLYKNKECFFLAVTTGGREVFVFKTDDSKFISYISNAVNEAMAYQPQSA